MRDEQEVDTCEFALVVFLGLAGCGWTGVIQGEHTLSFNVASDGETLDVVYRLSI